MANKYKLTNLQSPDIINVCNNTFYTQQTINIYIYTTISLQKKIKKKKKRKLFVLSATRFIDTELINFTINNIVVPFKKDLTR